MKRIVMLCIVFLLVMSIGVFAQPTIKHMKLLAVSQDAGENNLHGSVADLSIELHPGKGRVFIETFPLTKVDTQISTRLAKQIACELAEQDCDNYDFIYTIRSGSPTIGGPSAGAAIAGLTYAALKDLPIRDDVTVTGTIGSGGLVGPVGGVLPKVGAGSKEGLNVILIPAGEREVPNGSSVKNVSDGFNLTNLSVPQHIDVVQYGAKRDVEVVEVNTLQEVVTYLTGQTFENYNQPLVAPDYYDTIMGSLAQDLCNRAQEARDAAVGVSIHPTLNISENISQVMDRGDNSLNLSRDALEHERPYAAASYCFGAGLQFRYAYWLSKDSQDVAAGIENITEEISFFPLSNIQTITHLQTAMLVQERVQQAEELVDDARKDLVDNNSVGARYQLAYAQERFYSAQSWSAFFEAPGKDVELDYGALKVACTLRLQEAQERQQYAAVYFPIAQERSDDLKQAFKEQQFGDYVMCIFYASKAKAYYDIVVSGVGIDAQQQLQNRLAVAQQVINRQIQENVFPIAAFSYAEYAKSLAQSDTASAFLYVQYAIELSDIGIYLESNQVTPSEAILSYSLWNNPRDVFMVGFVIGMVFAVVSYRVERFIRSKHPKRSKRFKK